MPEFELKITGRGPIGRIVRRSVREAKAAGRVGRSASVLAEIATRTADLADAAAVAGDAKLLVATLRDLRQLVPRLELDDVPAPVEGVGGGDDDDGADVDPALAELEALMGSGPTVGDAALAGAPYLRAADRPVG